MKSILKTVTLLIVSIVIGVSMQSCASVKPIDKADLAGYWELKSLNGEEAKAAFTGAIPSIEFDFEKNMVTGSAGCNRYNSAFILTEQNAFTAKAPVSTKMLCMDANKEPEFLNAIGTPDLTMSLTEDGVLTFAQDKNILLEFVKGEAPKVDGVKKVTVETVTGKWKLTSFPNEDLAKLYGDKVPTMELTADGKAFGNAGCNTYRSDYELKEGTLTLGRVVSTMMACPNLEGEGKFLKVLEKPTQPALNGDVLTFLQEGNTVLIFTKVAE